MEMFQGITLPVGMDVTRIAAWLNVLLVLLLAYSMATLSWQLFATSQSITTVSFPGVSSGAISRTSGPSLTSIAALHLFGEAGSVPASDAQAPIDAPETRLKFTLKGVFAGDRSDNAMAIITSGGNDEKSYRVGDVVAGAATLHQILGDRVILKRGEQLETLYLPKEADGLVVTAAPPVHKRVVPSNINSVPARPLHTDNIGQLRQQLMENPQDALQLINAQPVMENGQLTGFRVNPGKDRALFARVGLRPGDIITAVNGMQLSDATQMGEVFQQLKSAQQLNVTINRGGREQQLDLKLD